MLPELILIALIMKIFAICYTALILKEPEVVIQNDSDVIDEKTPTEKSNSNFQPNELKAIKNKIQSTEKEIEDLSIKNKILVAIKDIIFVLTKLRNGRGRMIVWLLLVCNFIFVGCRHGKIWCYHYCQPLLSFDR